MDPDDLLDSVLAAMADQPKPTRMGTIDPAHTTGDPQVEWDGEDAPTTKAYKTLGSYTPKAGDRVVAVAAGSTWVILGQIGGQDGVPVGGIILWSGAVVDIPEGFALCDGANDTPDLRDRFVVAAGGQYAPGDTGGTDTATMPSHSHTYFAPASFTGAESGTSFNAPSTDSQTTTGTEGGTGDNRPRYYALAFIMRVG